MNELLELTDEEEKAISALEKLGERWPKTLLIYASGGNALSIRKGGVGHQYEVDTAYGFPNDGGDGGDEF